MSRDNYKIWFSERSLIAEAIPKRQAEKLMRNAVVNENELGMEEKEFSEEMVSKYHA